MMPVVLLLFASHNKLVQKKDKKKQNENTQHMHVSKSMCEDACVCLLRNVVLYTTVVPCLTFVLYNTYIVSTCSFPCYMSSLYQSCLQLLYNRCIVSTCSFPCYTCISSLPHTSHCTLSHLDLLVNKVFATSCI